ncbi:MAG TPA: L,D-transpeptidase [Thermomicrobiales bacterium]|nr:L,D-transpeptidase [Thermomicrobiales bacterium]
MPGAFARAIARLAASSLLLALLSFAFAGSAAPRPATAAAATATAASDSLAGVELPPDLGQTSLQVYVPQTEHTLRGSMLDFWRANGAASIYGDPISEPFAGANDLYSQAFQNGVFQFHAELIWTDSPMMSLMPVSGTILNDRAGAFLRDGRRDGGGGDPRDYAWSPVDPNGSAATKAVQGGGIYSDNTAHTITGEFLKWYDANEGASYLGDPLSQPVHERGMTVQYFQGGLMMSDANGNISLGSIVAEHAQELGIDTAPVAQQGLPDYDESLFMQAPNPNPLGDPTAPGKKWVEVSISQQTLWAYQGTTLVSQTLVSTGIPPNTTELGVFHVRLKYPKQDMQGFINSSGEVAGFGNDAPAGTIPYDVKDIPNVMYFDSDAEALHGAYWHNNFGNEMSHGCVNLPLPFAAWMYGWAPLGTMVWVHN